MNERLHAGSSLVCRSSRERFQSLKREAVAEDRGMLEECPIVGPEGVKSCADEAAERRLQALRGGRRRPPCGFGRRPTPTGRRLSAFVPFRSRRAECRPPGQRSAVSAVVKSLVQGPPEAPALQIVGEQIKVQSGEVVARNPAPQVDRRSRSLGRARVRIRIGSLRLHSRMNTMKSRRPKSAHCACLQRPAPAECARRFAPGRFAIRRTGSPFRRRRRF